MSLILSGNLMSSTSLTALTGLIRLSSWLRQITQNYLGRAL
jgi:hypothetical protein